MCDIIKIMIYKPTIFWEWFPWSLVLSTVLTQKPIFTPSFCLIYKIGLFTILYF